MVENITVNIQNSIKINSGVGIIYVDPLGIGEETHDADFILITHDHYDHFSTEDIRKVAKQESILVIPEKMSGKARPVSSFVGKTESVTPGILCDIKGLQFETIPAYNLLKPFHPKSAGWVGYLLQIDGKRIYVAGDTDATKEARAVACDIALVPIGGTYTMDPKKAAELVNEIRPEVVIPVHYGSMVGKPTDGKVFAENINPPTEVVFKLEF